MAKYDITHSCGHMHTTQIVGREDDRPAKALRLAERSCPKCEQAERKTQLAADSELAATRSADEGMPGLVGTPKQVAWAETIRREAMDAMAKAGDFKPRAGDFVVPMDVARCVMRQIGGAGEAQATTDAIREAGKAAIHRLRAETSASWWIDNRGKVVDYVQDAGAAALRERMRPYL